MKFTPSFGCSRGFFHVSVSSTCSFHSFAVWNRYPFSVLVKFELWNLIIFMICVVFQRLSRNLPMFVFVFVKKLTSISFAIMLVPGPSGNTKLAYWTVAPTWPILGENYTMITQFSIFIWNTTELKREKISRNRNLCTLKLMFLKYTCLESIATPITS